MAPPAAPAARSGGVVGNKPINRKPVVVPAIPLPYIQRQPKPAPAAATKPLPKDDKAIIPPSEETQTARSPPRSAVSIPASTSAAAVNGELADKIDSLKVKSIAQKTEAPTEPNAVTPGPDQSVGEELSTSAGSGIYFLCLRLACVF